MNYDQAIQNFKTYVQQFDMNNKNIYLKYDHTFSVANWMERLAQKMNLSEKEIELAKTIGLLHDIGRFYQIQETNSFNDQKLDHAVIGCQYLFTENHIRDFSSNPENDHFIQFSIENHNKLTINPSTDQKEILLTKMIRDMDKLDIYRVSATYFESTFNKDELSPLCLKAFLNQIQINRQFIKTQTDSILSELAFIFDMNFKESFELLKESGYLEFYIQAIKIAEHSEEQAQQIFQRTRKFLQNQTLPRS